MANDPVPAAMRALRGVLTPSNRRHVSPDCPGNLVVVRRLMTEVWEGGDLGLLPELVADDYVGHQPIGDHYGPGGARIDIEAYRRAIPDLTVTLDDLLAVDDRIIRRYTLFGTLQEPLLGIPASGRPITLGGLAIDRLVLGRLVESWVQIGRIAE